MSDLRDTAVASATRRNVRVSYDLTVQLSTAILDDAWETLVESDDNGWEDDDRLEWERMFVEAFAQQDFNEAFDTLGTPTVGVVRRSAAGKVTNYDLVVVD